MKPKPNQNQSGGLKPLVDYITRTNKQEIAQMLQNENFEKRIEKKSSTEVAQDVMSYLGKEKKQGRFLGSIKKVLNAHPDKDLILEMFGKPLPKKMDVMEYNAFDANANANPNPTYDTTGAATSKTPIFEKPIAKISIVVVILVVLIILLLYID